jgi:recombination associated protein RdgC
VGAVRGSISYTLYYVQGELPAGFQEEFLQRICEFVFTELTPQSDADTQHGWCVLDRMLDLDFTREKIFRGSYLSLGLRVDRWSLPGALLKARMEAESEKWLADKGRTRLLRSEKDAIRDMVVRELKQQLIPSASMVDMVWNLDEGQVRFWSQTSARLELFEELFESTFGVRLVQANAWSVAMNSGLDANTLAGLDSIEQAAFTDLGPSWHGG